MAVREEGVPAVSLTGSQSGIMTNDAHSNARIIEVRPFRIQDELDRGRILPLAVELPDLDQPEDQRRENAGGTQDFGDVGRSLKIHGTPSCCAALVGSAFRGESYSGSHRGGKLASRSSGAANAGAGEGCQ
jgi:hypothetical protein